MSIRINRRQAVGAIGAGLAASTLLGRGSRAIGAQATTPAQPSGGEVLTLPPLPYAATALEPSIDAETMEIHHDRHHKAYVDNANKALAGTRWAEMKPELILASLGDVPEEKRGAIRNNVGGHVNHTWFWSWMAPAGHGGGGEPVGALADSITKAFGSFGAKGGFKEQFGAAGTSRFGSGWAWLVVREGRLAICSTANQDNPLMGEKIAGAGTGGTPILGLDVWEHAYYLKYRNKRAEYIEKWWDVVNWPRVAELFAVGAGK